MPASTDDAAPSPAKRARGQEELSIAVYGCGAVGLSIAGLLLKAGHHPTLVARGKKLQQLKTKGLKLQFAGELSEFGSCAAADPSQGPPAGEAPRILFLCLKGHQMLPAMADLLRWVGPHTIVVAMQNGIPYWYCQGQGAGPAQGKALPSLPQEVVDKFVPWCRAHVGAVLYLTANEAADAAPDGPLHVSCTSIRGIILGGTGAGAAEDEAGAVAEVVDVLQGAGVPGTKASTTIRRDVWHKLLGNGAFNPMSALTLQPLGYLVSEPRAKAMVRRCMSEMLSVAVKLGVYSEGEVDVDARLAVTAGAPPGFKTSMLQDVEAGREPEVGPLLGAVLDLAALVGAETPTLSVLHTLISARADALRGSA